MRVIISSGIVVIGIILMRKIMMEKISRRLQYIMWLFVPFFLIISTHVSIEVPISLKRIENTATTEKVFEAQQKNIGVMTDIAELGNYNKEIISNAQVIDQPVDSVSYDVKKIWEILKKGIAIALLAFYAVNNILFSIFLFQKRCYYEKNSEVGLNIYLIDHTKTPFLFGRNIYLHEEMITDTSHVRYMILHEFCHYKQGDGYWIALKYICCAIFWYNPFVWLASYYVTKDCELACDEAVIKLIGMEQKCEYGMTLLHLAKRKKYTDFTVGTTMGGEKGMIRERIVFLSKPFYENRRSAIVCVLSFFALMIILLLKPELNYIYQSRMEEVVEMTGVVTAGNLQGAADTSAESSKADEVAVDNCYNFIKNYADKLYYISSGSLCEYDLKKNVMKRLINGNMRLASVSDEYLYYLKYPEDSTQKAGIRRLNLTTLKEEDLLPWKDEYWNCVSILENNDYLYLEIGNTCEAYLLGNEKISKLNETENRIAEVLEAFDLTMGEAYGINNYFVNSIINYSAFTVLNSNKNELYICEVKSGNVVKKENCLGNVLINEYGIIYTSLKGDIFLSRWEDPENDQLLFSAEKEGYRANYGTYNQSGLFIFRETGEEIECKSVSWEGKIKDILEIEDTRLAVQLQFSVFPNFAAYQGNADIAVVKFEN